MKFVKAARTVFWVTLAAAWLTVWSTEQVEAYVSTRSTSSSLTGIITPSDPTACTVSAAQPRKGVWGSPHPWGLKGPPQYDLHEYWRFNASCDGGANTFMVRILVADGYTSSEAASEAEKYAKAIGRLPKVLRSGIKGISMSKLTNYWSVLTGGQIFGSLKVDKGAALEETIAHEAVHASLDSLLNVRYDPRWMAAQIADGAFISGYAQSYPTREDLAESFVAYLAARYRPGRISRAQEARIFKLIPNRIAYFDAMLSANDMKPFATASPRTAGIIVYDDSLSMNAGTAAAYDIRLAAPPDAAVTVTPESNEVGVATVNGSLTFTKRNWHIPQTVRVTGVAQGTASIAHTTASSDSNYAINAANLPTVSAKVVAASTLSVFNLSATGSVTEGQEKDIAITLKGTVAKDVTLPSLVAHGAGITAADYQTTGTIDWSARDRRKTQKLRTLDDNEDEPTEIMTVTFEGRNFPDGTQPGTSAVVNVLDNDPTKVTLSGAGDVVEGADKILTLTLGRALVSGEALSVPLTFGGTAVRGARGDYTLSCPSPLPAGVACSNLESAGAMVSFTGPSAQSVTLTFTARQDGSDEGSETVSIGLGSLNESSGTGLGGGARGIDRLADFHILEIAAKPTVSLSVNKAEADEGGLVIVTAALSKSLGKNVNIPLILSQASTADVTDYTLLTTSILIRAGSTSGSAQILLTDEDEDDDEPAENLILTLGALPQEVEASSSRTAVVKILDNNPNPMKVTVSGDSGSIARGGTKTITISLDRQLVAGETLKVKLDIGQGSNGTTATYAPQNPGWVFADYILACENPLPAGVSCPNLNRYVGSGGKSMIFTFTGPSAKSLDLTLTAHDKKQWKDREERIEKTSLKFSIEDFGTNIDTNAILIDRLTDYNLLGTSPASEDPGTSPASGRVQATLYLGVGDPSKERADRVFVTEGKKVTLTVSLTHPHADPQTYNVAHYHKWTDNTASRADIRFKDPVDHTKSRYPNQRDRQTTDIYFPAGVIEVSTVIDVVEDAEVEGEELVIIGTWNEPAHNLADPFPRALIVINDKPLPKVSVSPWLPVVEGDKAGFSIAADTVVDTDLSVKLIVAESGGGDFVSAANEGSKTVTIPKGKKLAVFTVDTDADDTDESDGAVTVTVEADSNDPATYAVSADASASVAVSDDDEPGNPVNLSISGSAITEGTAALIVTATLGSNNASGAAISIPIAVEQTGTSAQADDYTIATSISIPNGAASGVTTLSVTNDTHDETKETVAIELGSSLPPDIRPGSARSVTVTIIDDDATEVSLERATSGEVIEGNRIEFSVTLGRELVAGETVDVPLVLSGVADSDVDELMKKSGSNLNTGVSLVNAATLTPVLRFSGSGARVGTFELTVTEDAISEGAETLTVALGPDGDVVNGFDISSRNTNVEGGADPHATNNEFEVNITDNKGISVTPLSLALTELHTEDAIKTYTLVLKSDPLADVTIKVTSSDATAVMVDTDAAADGDQNTMIFTHGTSGTWNDEQTVMVRALNDADAADEVDVRISHVVSVDSDNANIYHGIDISDVMISVTDAGHGVVVSKDSLSVDAGGGSVEYGVVLMSAPDGTLVLSPASDDTEKATVSGPLTFTNANWSTPQSVTVTGAGAGTTAISHSVTTVTSSYPSTMSVNSITVTVTADPRPTVELSSSASDAKFVEGSSIDVTATLSGGTLGADVSIPVTVTGGQTTDYTFAGSIDIEAGENSGKAKLDALDDTHDEPTETLTLALGTLPLSVRAGTTTSVALDIIDSDATAVTLEWAPPGTAAVIDENGGKANFTVTIGRGLIAGENVTVPISVTGTGVDANDYTLSLKSGDSLNNGVGLDIETPRSAVAPAIVFTGAGDDPATSNVSIATLEFVSKDDSEDEATGETAVIAMGSVTSNLDIVSGTGGGGTNASGTAQVTITDDDDPTAVIIDAALIAQVRERAEQTYHGTAHVTRWRRVLIAFGVETYDGLTPMTAAEAEANAQNHSSPLWPQIAEILAKLQSKPVVTVAAGSGVTEGAAATFTFSAAPVPTGSLSVGVTIAVDGDYGIAAVTRNVVIPASGEYILSLATDNDSTDEANGSVTVTVQPGSGYTVGTASSGTVAIADDDASSLPEITITAGAGVTEGNAATFTIAANPVPANPVTVSLALAETGDFGASGAATVTVSADSTTYTVTTSDDSVDEANGSVTVTVQPGSGYTVGTASSGTVAIADDDASSVPEITITAGAGVTEGNAATFTIAANPVPANPVTVSLALAETGDFGASGAATVTVSADSTTYTVTTSDDSVDEANGSVTVTVQPGSGYTVGTASSGTVAIADDDDPPAVIIDASLIAQVRAGAEQTHHGTAHVTRWRRVLIAFGVETYDGLTPMTAAEAEANAQNHSSPLWPQIAEVLAKLQSKPVVTVAAGSGVTEGAAATFTFSAAPAPTGSLSVGVTIAVDGDYGIAAVTRNVVIPASGEYILSLATDNDSTDEANGSVTVTVQPGGGYTVGTASSGTVAIADDDAASPIPEITITAGAGVTEGNAATFTIAANPVPANPVTVSLALAETGDFGASGAATVTVSAVSTTYTVTTSDDSVDEANGSVTVTVQPGSGYTVGTASSGTVAIADDDAASPIPEITITAGAGVTEGNAATFTIAANPVPANPVTVSLALAETGDFGASGAATVTVSADSTTYTVTTSDDSVDEANGSVTVTVQPGGGYTVGTASSGTVAIADDDATSVPEITITAGAGVTEGNAATFTIAANPVPANPVTVSLALAETGDFGASGAATVTVSAVSTTYTVTTSDDSVDEANGSVTVTVQPGGGYTVGTASSGTVAIADDDQPTIVVSITAKESLVKEGGKAMFTLNADRAPDANLTVSLSVSETGSGDYVAAQSEGPATATIAKGETEATFSIATVDDDTDEPDGEVTVTLNDGGGYTVSPSQGATTVAVSDDTAVGLLLSIDDATVKEDVWFVAFTVRLSAPTQKTVQFNVATRPSTPVSATPNIDYTTVTYKNLKIRAGETERQVWVGIYNDSHDEGAETFEIVLSSVQGAVVGDGVAVGTIVNSDPLPAAWLARFGRTVAEQALDSIKGRTSTSRTAGINGTIAGQPLKFDPALGDETVDNGVVPIEGRPVDTRDSQHRSMSIREALLGSSFVLTTENDSTGGNLAFWGQMAQGNFDGVDKRDSTQTSVHGEVSSAMIGMDYARDNHLFGIILMRNTAEGDYGVSNNSDPCPGTEGNEGVQCNGDMDVSLTSLIPYMSLDVSERLDLLIAAGVGNGELKLKPGAGVSYSADTDWNMVAAELRGSLLNGPAEGSSGASLALTADTLWARTSSEKTSNLSASKSSVTRLRIGLEASYNMALVDGGSVVPRLEIGARHDGGDAETGTGIELGGGLAWNAPSVGIQFNLEARTLVSHQDKKFENRGLAASVVFDPDARSDLGLSLAVHQRIGSQSSGGLHSLFRSEPLENRSGVSQERHLSFEGSYGISALGGAYTASPYGELSFGQTTREQTLGWRWSPVRDMRNLSFAIRTTRSEVEGEQTQYRFGVDATARW